MAGGYREQWWGYNDVNCTKEELCKALGNYLSTEALMIGKDNQDTIARKVRYIYYHSSRVEKTDSYRKYFVFNQCGLKFRSIMSNKGNLEVEIARLATSARLKLLERQNSMSCNLCFSLLNYRIML